MKTLILSLATLTFTLSSQAATQTLSVDSGSSELKWVGRKEPGSRTCTFPVHEGKFNIKAAEVSSGTLVLKLKEFTCTDKSLEDRLKHIPGFSIENHPDAIIKITKFQEFKTFAPGSPNAKLSGTIEILGMKKPFSIDAYFKPEDKGFRLNGTWTINTEHIGQVYRPLLEQMNGDDLTFKLVAQGSQK